MAKPKSGKRGNKRRMDARDAPLGSGTLKKARDLLLHRPGDVDQFVERAQKGQTTDSNN